MNLIVGGLLLFAALPFVLSAIPYLYEDWLYGRERVDEEFERRFATALGSALMMPRDAVRISDLLNAFTDVRFTGVCIFDFLDNIEDHQRFVDRRIRLPDPRPTAGDSPDPLPFIDPSVAPLVFLWNSDEYKFVRLDYAFRQMARRGERPPIHYRFDHEADRRCYRFSEPLRLHATQFGSDPNVAPNRILQIRIGSLREAEDMP